MNIVTYGRVGLLSILLAGVATGALAKTHPHKAPAPDARIGQLQAEVDQLLADRQAQQAQEQARQAKEDALAARADELAVEVDDLKRGQAAEITTLGTVQQAIPAAPAVKTTFANGRPVFTSADGQFSATLHGVMQLDTGAFDQDKAGPVASDFRRDGPGVGSSTSNVDALHARDLKDGTLFRRARLGIDGTAFGDFDYRVLLDFGGSGVENAGQIYETWVQYNGFKPFRLRVGAFSPSIGLDDQASTNGMPFIERAGSSDAARGLAAGDTRVAAQAFGYGDHWLAAAAITGRTIGVINTAAGASAASPAVTGTAATYGDQLGFVARLAGTPFYGSDWRVHVGVHGSWVDRPADTTGPSTVATGATPLTARTAAFSDTPEQRIDGTKLVNTGNIDAKHAGTAGVEFAFQKGPFLLQSEYDYLEIQRDDVGLSSPHFSGYYVSGTWLITGEQRVYNTATAAFDAPPVKHPFNPKAGTWGAFELAARYSDLDLNYHAGAGGTAGSTDAVRGGDQAVWTAGLNWYLNPVVRFVFDYQNVKIDRLSPNATNFNTPIGAQIGQSYNAFIVRSQVAF